MCGALYETFTSNLTGWFIHLFMWIGPTLSTLLGIYKLNEAIVQILTRQQRGARKLASDANDMTAESVGYGAQQVSE